MAEIPSFGENPQETNIMAKRKRSRSRRTCGCPSTAVKVSTKGRGKGFVCVRKTPKVTKRHGLTYVTHPFVKGASCR